MEPSRKASRTARLSDLADMRSQLPHISQVALAAICKWSQDHGLPQIRRRDDVRGARDMLAQQHTPYGPLLVKRDLVLERGGVVTVELAHPCALLWVAAKTPYFSALLKQTALDHPPSATDPWDLCLYHDEITPGNPLKPMSTKKLQGVYWGFLRSDLSRAARRISGWCQRFCVRP